MCQHTRVCVCVCACVRVCVSHRYLQLFLSGGPVFGSLLCEHKSFRLQFLFRWSFVFRWSPGCRDRGCTFPLQCARSVSITPQSGSRYSPHPLKCIQ